MENWIKKEDCTGCGACRNICPRNAIIMKESVDGFRYPAIDNEKCINCNMCQKTCPILSYKKDNNEFPKVYAGWSKNEKTRFTSTSGGIFTELVSKHVELGGYVIAAGYNNSNMVEHKVTNSLIELEGLKQSKYLQSDTNTVFIKTKKLLNNNKKVIFCGSPCQIAALRKFLNGDHNNLLTIEFICRGMNSPKAYRCWLNEIEKRQKSKAIKVWFKYKDKGWKASPKCTRIDFENGKSIVLRGKKNLFMTGYLGPNLYIRQSCGKCKFNGLPRVADITLADFWGISNELDDDKGTSLILLNNDKAIDFFEFIKSLGNICFFERNLNEIENGNTCFGNSVSINKQSKAFLSELSEDNFSSVIKKYIPREKFYKRFIKRIKKIMKIIIVKT